MSVDSAIAEMGQDCSSESQQVSLAFGRLMFDLLLSRPNVAVAVGSFVAGIANSMRTDVSMMLSGALQTLQGCLRDLHTGSSVDLHARLEPMLLYVDRVIEPVDYWKHEAERLKERLIFMEEAQRNMMGENLGGLQIKDLQTLEGKLDSGLNKVRAVKTHLLVEQVQELRKKEQVLLQQNDVLRSKLAEATCLQAPTSGVTTTTTTSQEVQESSSARASVYRSCSSCVELSGPSVLIELESIRSPQGFWQSGGIYF
ncbi:hypothetical protein L7F22_055254 [Adiantum nelumboides]|nr:hypothetical protein [Adiantum nelumboides]